MDYKEFLKKYQARKKIIDCFIKIKYPEISAKQLQHEIGVVYNRDELSFQ